MKKKFKASNHNEKIENKLENQPCKKFESRSISTNNKSYDVNRADSKKSVYTNKDLGNDSDASLDFASGNLSDLGNSVDEVLADKIIFHDNDT